MPNKYGNIPDYLVEQIERKIKSNRIEERKRLALMNNDYLRLLNKKERSQLENGILFLFSACLNKDKEYDDSPQQFSDFRKAGEMIYSAGTKLQEPNILWSEWIWERIPSRLSRCVEIAWDGIGSWRG